MSKFLGSQTYHATLSVMSKIVLYFSILKVRCILFLCDIKATFCKGSVILHFQDCLDSPKISSLYAVPTCVQRK